MKKLFISAFAMLAVALGFTACSSDDELVNETSAQGKKVIVYATTEEPAAQRTTLDKVHGNETTGYPVLWSAGDKIKIGKSGGKVFTLVGDGGSSTGEFEGTAPAAGTYEAYYPSSYSGTSWQTSQTYVAGNIPPETPMKATGVTVYSDGTFSSPINFKNAGGILRLNLKGTAKVASIKISATNLTEPITLDCGSTGVQLNETTATPFHIAVPTPDDVIAYTGLKIEITDVDYWVCTKTAKSAINVFRSLITDITLTLAESSFVAPDYLCFTATGTNTTIQMFYEGEESRPNLQYSTNLRTWNNMGTSTIKLAEGEKVYFRGDNPNGFNKNTANYTLFNIPYPLSASGNVMSLIDPTLKKKSIPSNYCFYRLFKGCGLTTAPKLPATIMVNNCYEEMFKGCWLLEDTPELPATSLAKECYKNMFQNCNTLETVPSSLPATTLAEGCYYGMFQGCEKMKDAPELPAPITVKDCYTYMFSKCLNLFSITCLATYLEPNCTFMWVENIDRGSGATFTVAKGTRDVLWSSRGASSVPPSWIIKEKE